MTSATSDAQHDTLNDELNAYLDGQLDAARRVEVERHLETCVECRADLDELRVTRAALRAQPLLRAPRPFVIPAAEARPSRWLGLFAWGWRLGSVATAACVVLTALSAGERPAVLMSRPEAGGAIASKSEPRDAAQERSAAPLRDSARAAAPAAPAAGTVPAALAGQAGGASAGQPAVQPTSPAAPGAPAANVAAAQTGAPRPTAAPPAPPDQAAGQLALPQLQAQGQGQADAAAPRDGVSGARPEPPSWGVWAAAALAFGAASATLFALERRARGLR